jgi:uncharacterized protein
MADHRDEHQGEIVDNPDAGRYELRDHGAVVGVVEYRLDGEVMVIPHVEVAPALRGTGRSAPFLDEVLARIDQRGLQVRPLCGYAAGHIRSRPHLHHLLAAR